MKIFFIAVLLFGAACGRPEFNESQDEFEKEFNILVDDPEEEAKEAEKLKKAEDEINENNKKFENGESSFKEKLYPESVLSKEEFEKEKEGSVLPVNVRSAFSIDRSMGVIMPPESERTTPENEENLRRQYEEMDRSIAPDSYNAVDEGLVTPAKSQGACGSCVAFASTGLHEACMLKAGAPMKGLDLSEQYLIDCGYNECSMNACNGAYPHAYTMWFAKDGGVSPHEVKYPYLDRNPKLNCDTASTVPKWNSGAKLEKSVYDFKCDAEKMKSLVASKGVVQASLYASDASFNNYASGVFSGCTSNRTNHAVLVVGYGTEDGNDYWLVKNSWGENWGENGFIKIRRGTNECGIEKLCIVSDCVDSGDADPAPVVPKPPPPPANLYCDISRRFGSGITGNYRLQVMAPDGSLLVSTVSCENSNCTPLNPGPSNACMYICGEIEC